MFTRYLSGLFVCLLSLCVSGAQAAPPANFLYTGEELDERTLALLARPDIDGIQIIYNWRELEPAEGEFDFSAIRADLESVQTLDKKLFIQLQDRFFSSQWRPIPQYILTEPDYAGGLVPQIDNPGEGVPQQQGWVTIQWNPFVRARFQNLIIALADEFDGDIYGINLPESAIDIDQEADETGFSCDRYYRATLENVRVASTAFRTSHVVQYVNFWPCEWNNDQGYMQDIFEDAVAQGYGLGGPDIVPYRRGQMKNAYPFFNKHREELDLVAMAVQEPTLTYTNPETGAQFEREDFVDFAQNYLGVDVIFWTVEAPWLTD
ncbi:hypothetical protein [Parvularcula sp. LCG005]|uniref:hypothetical protein n=1 Tax=Parvularcula sp. LCG005 TaxID=3078805 RepID=UPI002943022B|nr:hypothetical protein [Parvularcula sp. LCG005]WOI54083.1 hypothetical protein RUI03_03545 [Parvularcula sp. LCG005]